ncbi:MAG: DUF2254 family protein [Brevibacterium aurantiacum]
MGAALRDGDSEAGPARRETAADRREWAAMCRQVRVPTMWGIPLRLFLLALGAVLPALDRALAPPHAVAVRRRRRAPRGDVVLAVNIPRLLDCEGAWGMRIELVPSLGTPVPSGGFLFRTSVPVGRAQCRALESALAFGDVLSPASGPFGAIRAMVDIALKALSPAVNDPSRVVQALEEIEDILAELAPYIAKREALLAAHPDASVLRDWTRSWADYVAAATDEIRQYGTGSVQIQRRLRALFDTLAGQCELQQRAALLERRAALHRGLERWWPDPLDRRLAGCADPQGLGRALGTAARAEQAPEPEAPPA